MSTQDKTIIVSTNSVNVIFNNDNNKFSNSPFLNVSIIVKLLQYTDGKQYYDITYNYEFNKGNLIDIDEINIIKKNMLNFGLNKDSMKGEIIFKNDMISTMITYLLMDDITLEKYTSHTTVERYRKNIMISLSHFWD
jgi:hypothetical protein